MTTPGEKALAEALARAEINCWADELSGHKITDTDPDAAHRKDARSLLQALAWDPAAARALAGELLPGLDDLRALSEAATPGPWHEDIEEERGDYGSLLGRYVTGLRADDGRRVFAFDDDYGTDQGADASFIAAAVNFVRAALKEQQP